MKTSATWKLKDAREHFDEVIEDAIEHGPQTILIEGRGAVVVSIAPSDCRPRKHLLEILRSAPLAGEDLVIERVNATVRDVDLDA